MDDFLPDVLQQSSPHSSSGSSLPNTFTYTSATPPSVNRIPLNILSRESTRITQKPSHFTDYICKSKWYNLVTFESLPSTNKALITTTSLLQEPVCYAKQLRTLSGLKLCN